MSYATVANGLTAGHWHELSLCPLDTPFQPSELEEPWSHRLRGQFLQLSDPTVAVGGPW